MEQVKNGLLRLVRAGRMAKELDGKMTELGYSETPYSIIYGEIADAIYAMIGEETELFTDSLTYWALNSSYDYPNEKQWADILASVWHNNEIAFHPLKPETAKAEQPKPKIFSKEEIGKMVSNYDLGAGYMYQTPEGEWK